ncbi:MAG: transporter substrate-binding domain-containing protein [Candidatus Eisenbacteria bacterium]|nr:transporter substrate-binding domain-containing protein [Candidatus Latescibacterota bacterium]MBD3302011.1 transporter substrate-binding domain-containing protein [Candidatus Eisenbacteria bacterium]
MRFHPVIRSLLPLSGILFAFGCGGEESGTLARIREEGTFRIGTDATYPPFATIDPTDETVVGFDADLMRRIGKEMGVAIRFEILSFDGILAALRGGEVDAVISAMTITEERAEEVLFSRPYHVAGQSLCIRDDASIQDFDDLRGRRIGVQLGTTGERTAQRVPNAEVVSFDAIGAAWIDLRNGRLDAVLTDTPTALVFCRRHPEIRIVGDPVAREWYGIAFRREDRGLKEEIDRILERLEEDGTLRELRLRYGMDCVSKIAAGLTRAWPAGHAQAFSSLQSTALPQPHLPLPSPADRLALEEGWVLLPTGLPQAHPTLSVPAL